ncbi:glycosyltransferase family 4 protein [Heyndrickxia coagulans]|uniref:glycosyltransferase family 4 protein n=1 Tax=Heyndrickxia coagulans TaxID=1398 RepID=UPI000779718B|nr:glycosyltransferase family 4 protein [Heyndrickxia coagulans]KYC63713.1 hypothetical protein B4100_0931 [Heyndrickxia coagulans]MED4313616.1 glycosyltransferase family 4 protein [Heyndrickxia coagulans]UZH05021.1 glycosyltransferase family 4 protein [Heyndrickxia coagulans]
MNIGFVCTWDKEKDKTWSGTPMSLYKSLEAIEGVKVTNIDVQLSKIEWGIVALTQFMRRKNLSFNTLALKLMSRKLNKKLKGAKFDAVIEIGDIGIIKDINYYVYQDLCIYSLIEEYKNNYDVFVNYSGFGKFSLEDLYKRNKWQKKFYDHCSGIFTMSEWLKQTIERNYNITKEKIHTVKAGINVKGSKLNIEKDKNTKYILFVGRDFTRKNGLNVIRAFKKLSKSNKHLRLVIAGPESLPLNEKLTQDIIFLGDADYETLNYYYGLADVFCMPSYFEAYGIVFTEALVRGIPCVALNSYAMPEIIQDYGILVENGSVDEIAGAIHEILGNDAYKKNIERDMELLKLEYSWDNIANKMVNQIKKDLNYN